MISLKDKVALVTGSAGGLGRALAVELGHHGACLALVDSNESELAKTCGKLAEQGVPVISMAGDVTKMEDCQRITDLVRNKWKRLDLLVNNAGITHISLFENTGVGVLRRVMEVNFFGSVNCTRAALADIVDSQGMIVAMSSVAGIGPLPGRTGYCASKFALGGFFDTLRMELKAKGVGILLVYPSFINTGIAAHSLDGQGAPASPARSTMGRIIEPDTAARLIIRAIRKKRKRLMISEEARLAWWMTRLFPNLYAKIIRQKFGSLPGEH